jgi:hypothetical protein
MAQETSRKPTLHLSAPAALVDAVKIVANRQMTTISEYVRRSVIDSLKSDGINPLASISQKPSTNSDRANSGDAGQASGVAA